MNGELNIAAGERVMRWMLTFVLLAVVYTHEGLLGGLVTLPFIAAYLGLTAIIGWDPFYATYNHLAAKFKQSAQIDGTGRLLPATRRVSRR